MIEFKNSKIRVRCLECQKEQFIDIKLIGTEKQQRTISFEYEYTFEGELTCSCNESIKLLIYVYEYPKGIINYINIKNESCLVMDEINENLINVI